MTDKLSGIQPLLKFLHSFLHSEFPSETTAFPDFMQKNEIRRSAGQILTHAGMRRYVNLPRA